MDSENHNSFFFGHFSSFLGQQDGHFGPTTCMKQALGAPVQAPRPAAPSDSTLPQFINQYSSDSNRPVVISRAGRNRDSYLWAVGSSGSWTSAPFLEVFRTTPVKDIGPRSESHVFCNPLRFFIRGWRRLVFVSSLCLLPVCVI